MAATRQPGWWYPWIFVAGMGLVVAVNAVLITLAITTFPGLKTTDHYRKGLDYDRNIAAARAQAERGWRLDVAFQPQRGAGTAHAGTFSVQFRDRHDAPLGRLRVEAQFARPTHEGFDQSVLLEHAGGGTYANAVALPLPGLWDARIVARSDDVVFQETRRLVVP